MAKTINKDVDIFTTLKAAQKSFDKTPAPVALLKSNTGDFFVDKKGTGKESCVEAWPKLYTLIDEKKVESNKAVSNFVRSIFGNSILNPKI